jgi:signal transduction histidine kinase
MQVIRHRVLQPRSPLYERLDRWLRPIQARAGAAFLGLSVAISMVLLITVPSNLVRMRMAPHIEQWRTHCFAVAQEVSRAWARRPSLPAFVRGDEASLQAALQQDPLLVVRVERDTGRVWRRMGSTFQLAEEPAAQRWRALARTSESLGQMVWAPPLAAHDNVPASSLVVILGEKECSFREWTVGSPAVEAFLRQTLSRPTDVQVGLRRIEPTEQSQEIAPPWSQYPHLQAEANTDLNRHVFDMNATDDSLSGGWEMVVRPDEPSRRILKASIRRNQWIGWSLYAAMVSALALGLYLRHRTRERDRHLANRMASLAHSLKTPLTVLKLRCDSVRLGGLPEAQTDAQLIRIGEEVDHIVALLESNLERMGRSRVSSAPKSAIGAKHFQEIAADLAPAFEWEERPLVMDIETKPCRADLPSLRTALVTLLENALMHGKGATRFQVKAEGAKVVVRVRNESAHAPAIPLDQWGQPFLRSSEGREWCVRHGQGLGLSLLRLMAEREGWGLEFAHAPGEGFEAVLELPRSFG